ncbi:hypothetical protein [Blastococcus sp. CCUG 61487]|uniref:hypothetical protein n=1 Tax=Blastococcus sp. CCUG 61487 TaxID=1840703 RepID=UPI0010C0ECDD|nr:hypothetical protein [Blastococcus sp. CCUG 61487]TKJ31387.1 hypothetical protein A6V29_18315 [Blastococcus sp. CCUG 61487]
MEDLTTPRTDDLRDGPLPALGEEQPAGGPSPSASGVALDRLLALARLSAAQALEVGAGVLAAAARRPVGDAGIEQVVIDAVVTGEGTVVARSGRPDSGRPVAAVLGDVAAAARLPGAAADAERYLAHLDRAVLDLGTGSLAVAARRLQEAAAELDGPVIRAELGALARAVGEMTGRAPRAASGRTLSSRTATEEVPARRRRSAGRRVGAWLVSIAVLGTVVASGVALLGDDITRDLHLLLDAGREQDGGEDGGEVAGEVPPPPPPAPPAAGAVTGVDLRPLARCTPGALCSVRVLVRVVPAAAPQEVTWSYRVVDACTGEAATAPGGSVTVPPHADSGTVVGLVQLPAVAAAAVFAVTDAPAVAASAPVTTGTCSPPGPTG